MTYGIIQVIVMFFIPFLIIRYHNLKLTKLIGTIGMAYLLGIFASLLIFGLKKLNIDFEMNTDIGEIGSHLAISIAIPLLLFSSNLKEARKLSKPVLLSFGSLIVSVLIVTSITFYV
jgi:branched-subunit amino acid transport protein AzlD